MVGVEGGALSAWQRAYGGAARKRSANIKANKQARISARVAGHGVARVNARVDIVWRHGKAAWRRRRNQWRWHRNHAISGKMTWQKKNM